VPVPIRRYFSSRDGFPGVRSPGGAERGRGGSRLTSPGRACSGAPGHTTGIAQDARPRADRFTGSAPYSRCRPAAQAFRSAMRMHYTGVVFKAVRDSDWSARHIAAHDVTLDEVREAVLERPYWAVPGREGTTLVYGQTYAGRHLLVVAVDENGQAFIVTARDMTDAEKKTFRKKAR
jgi:uncharacterized protein